MKKTQDGTRARAARALFIVAALSAAAFAAQAADVETSSGPRFAISRFAVEGNSVLPAAEVERLLADFAGADRSFGDVRRAVQALQQAYRQRGYSGILVQLPEQELAQGVVRVQVIEPRIGRVSVQGNQVFSTANIRASLPALREGTQPNIRDISASLKVANTNPAKQLTLALQGAEQPDAVDAVISVTEDKPWRIGLNADNTGSTETGRTRLGVLYQHANLWDLDHVMTLQYTTSAEKPSKVSVFGVGYHVPLYALGDSMDFFASHSNVDSGTLTAGVLDLQVSGKGTVFGGRYNHNLPLWGDLSSTLIYGVDWRAYKNDIDLGGFQLGDDVTVHPLSLSYSGQLSLPSALLGLQLTGLQNIPGGANGQDADFSRQRAGASASYRVLRYGVGYNRQMEGDWQLRLQFNGQATRAALVPGEQFGAGGAGSVRGFREREVAGDQGQFASAEIQSPNWCPATAAIPVQCRALAFVDAAHVSRNKALPGEEQRTSISSAGLGLRFALDRRASLQVDYGRVLDGGSTRAAGDSRVHVALTLSY
ncbi:ShlB/FhaC/HecB family hemolysin secretion/activation protein [Polaromonas naphthalenivorans]|uniref:Polypeptide-transport-associated domain protein, ShlB-type n=1 Tax=Polaromonas naphthalenivorans (strain CJ2) TaxID=365044 RepID=A1VUH7_POLNA|nr:ShlB/FhaC/HecB family hemolysin secretion/activation protein [Polaromonas naphthalenivorans]ABM39305.1 Polypeptide-transport-associated domain protein, ShlB-type [Polaromonas naphthalenivorans CJ2]